MTISAYLLCKVRMGNIQGVVDALREVDVATSITVTTGEYDVIARVDIPDLESLYYLTINQICKIEGLEQVTTAVIEKEF